MIGSIRPLARRAFWTWAWIAVCLPLPAQREPSQGGERVATFVIGGKKRSLSRDDLALYLARRHRNSAGGKDAVEHLIEVELVKQAAAQAKVMPTEREVTTQVEQLRAQLRQRRMDLDEQIARARLSMAEFRAKQALSIAQARLVGKVLGIAPDKVTANHIVLWTKEQRNKVPIETDQSKLTPGVLARVGRGEVTSLDVGRVLFTKIQAGPLQEAIHRMVFEQCVAHEARRLNIQIAPAELEAQYARRKKAFESKQTNEGVDYEQWLEAFGSSKALELKSQTLRTTLLHGKLVRRRFPTEVLDQRLDANRELLLRRHGARRSLQVIFIRATDKPNRIVRRDFKAAEAHIQEIRETIIKKKRPFTLMAKVSSDDPNSKATGGAIGWQHREYLPQSRGRRLPQEVLDAAFQAKVGEITQPVRTENGFYLVWVNGEESEPDRSTLRNRLLGELAERYNRELFEAAQIEIHIQ